MIYLDNAATTYPKPECVYEAMDRANRELAFNAGRGSYQGARQATFLIDGVRDKLLRLVNATPDMKVVFAPSITIAMNQILNGLNFQLGDNVYVSPYEHNAVARTLHLIQKNKNINVIEIPLVDETLEIDFDKLKYMFAKQKPTCICCTHISNVTGYILPVEEIFQLSKQYDAVTVLDTAQSLGLLEIDAGKLNADFIAFTGHKSLYGPFGIGGFITSGKISLSEYIVGGTGSDSLNLDMPKDYPNQYEASSPNIVAMAGLDAALNEIDIQQIFEHEKMLTRNLVEELSKISGMKLYLPPPDSHIGIVAFNLEGYLAEDVGMILDEDYDIAVRTGYHCAPYIHKYLKDEKYLGTVRVGVGRYIKIQDINKLTNTLDEL